MDHKDIGRTGGNAGNIQEVYVIVGKCHDWLIRGPVWRRADVSPADCRCVRGDQVTHVKEVYFSFGQGVCRIIRG